MSLVNNLPSVYEIAENNPPKGWEQIFKELAPELKIISDRITQYEAKGAITFPRREDIFNAFRLTDPKTIKVLICGMDPYHSVEKNGTPTAMGLAFSVNPTAKIPPSLRNIFKELQNEYSNYITPKNGDLSNWASQGVFLLNMSLTVEKGTAGSHGNIWTPFITKIIDYIIKINPHIIFVLWGNPAKVMLKYLPKDSIILSSSHPSPLSATKTTTPFLGSNVFTNINLELKKLGAEEINWQT